MRKLFILLAVLIATPAFALTVTLVDNGNGTVNVNYAAVGDANQPRAFALTVSVSGGAVIDGVTPAKIGESISTSKGFGIFPGTININDVNGHVNSYGTPVAPDGDPGAGGTGIGTSSVVLELGSLYVGATNAPATSGTLCTISIDCNGATGVNVTAVEEDQYRGGVVLEDSSSASVTISLVTVCPAPVDCLKNVNPSSPTAEWLAWVDFGKPNCWCYKRQCRGDADGIKSGPYWVAASDLNLFKLAYNKSDTILKTITNGICADFDHIKSGPYRVAASDLNIMKTYYNKAETIVKCCDLDENCVLAAGDKWNFWTN